MEGEEFIKVLDKKGYSYEIEGDKLVVTGGDKHGDVDLPSLQTLPPGVEFKNRGNVNLSSLQTISPDVVFNNGGRVDLESLETLPPGVEFNSGRSVYLWTLIGGWLEGWSGNIEGIDRNMLFNSMISKGMFI